MKIKILLAFIFCINNFCVFSQQSYSVDASQLNGKIITGQLRMGNAGPVGREIMVNNRYMALGGKPIVPVMGEMHFSRVPRSQWEDRILKMKACGINIIACYVIWVHHEELEGQFNWSDNKDLHAFIELCGKHGLWVYPRIGPWCHAEVRNGGFPDWLLLKANSEDRSNNPIYQHYASEWYRQISSQLKGLLYKDGGPVIGVQLENEYGRGKDGEAHIMWLKNTAKSCGIDVPLYTVTGWGNGSVPPYEVVPLWGAYPDEPWASNLNRTVDCSNYHFTAFRNDEKIGNDVNKAGQHYIDYNAYPFFTCEVGVGIENTEHRRLQIGAIDGLSLMIAKIGSGSNLPGYYMFTGGSNPHGSLTTLEENKDETGYWNTNPTISYDFQAAIRESGALNDCYFEIKKLHYFLNEFGTLLAPMEPSFPKFETEIKYSVRSKDSSGFLFGLNYCRHNKKVSQRNVQFTVKLKNETLVFPSKSITIQDSANFIWPMNFDLNGFRLKYSTAQPLCQIQNTWVFIQDADEHPEFCFDGSDINRIETKRGKVVLNNGRYIVSDLVPGLDCVFTIISKNNVAQKVVVLSKEDAKHVWLFNKNGKKSLIVSKANMYLNDDKIHLFSTSNHFKIDKLNTEKENGDVFSTLNYDVPAKQINVDFREEKVLDNAQWLRCGAVDSLNATNVLMHRFFTKSFNVSNSSKIKKATYIIASQASARLQLNDTWVNQNIVSDSLCSLDVTGYLQKGENVLMLDFPFDLNKKYFAAKLLIEFSNADNLEFASDTSWITKDAYTYPSYLTKQAGFKKPETTASIGSLNMPSIGIENYIVLLPDNYLTGLNNLYLTINYTGDKAKLFFNQTLIADDFNSGSPFVIGLGNFGSSLEKSALKLRITPLQKDARVYFDDTKAKASALHASLTNVHLIPEYFQDVRLSDLLND